MSNAVKSGFTTAIAVFLFTFIPAVTGFLASLAKWSSSSGATPLPAISTLGYAAVSGVLAAIGGLVWGIFRWAQAHSDVIPGQPPSFQGTKG